MTTKVKITLVQPHIPVLIEVNGRELAVLVKEGDSHEDYVHSAQQLTVRELTTAELHDRG
jgi:PHD/YefM family antitoxin component YafN of YafNO toxin-antitoxin module